MRYSEPKPRLLLATRRRFPEPEEAWDAPQSVAYDNFEDVVRAVAREAASRRSFGVTVVKEARSAGTSWVRQVLAADI